MPALSIPEPARTIVLLGLILIPVALIAGFVSGEYDAERSRRTRRPFRLATSLVLVLCAALIWLSASRLADAAGAIFFGMAFSFLGDLILARVIRAPNRMIFGMLGFSAGHISYLIAFATIGQRLGLSNPFTTPPIWMGFVGGAALLWAAFVYSPRASRVLNLGALIYAGLIGVMAGAATSLAWHERRFWPTALGGLLFLISDVLLGNRELRNHPWFLVHDVVWVIYIFGQALIVLTTAWI